MAGILVASVLVLPAAGCDRCGDYDCAAGAPVVVSFLGLDDVASAEICFNEDCAASTMSTYRTDEIPDVPLASRDLEATDIEPGELFELSMRVFDEEGVVLATLSDTSRRKGDDDCGCDSLGYRWDGDSFAEW